jgi:hypothetical protein
VTVRTALLALIALSAAPSPAADPTIDQLVEKFAANRKAQEEARRAGEAILAELRGAIDALNRKLADLGVNPVVPPGPGPKPPDPADPLAAAVRAAYAADPAATKAEQSRTLAELYRQAADLTGDAAVTTAAQLMSRIRSAGAALRIDGLEAVRKLIAAECAAQLGTDLDAAMTAEVRLRARVLFLRVHEVLKGLSP